MREIQGTFELDVDDDAVDEGAEWEEAESMVNLDWVWGCFDCGGLQSDNVECCEPSWSSMADLAGEGRPTQW